MALKMIVNTLDGLDETAQSLYKEKEGKFHLDVEGAVEKERLDEFRSNNTKLLKELDEIKGKYNGIDLDEIKALKSKIQDLDDKKLIDAGKIDEVVLQKTERMKKDFEDQIQALKKAIDEKTERVGTVEGHLNRVLIDTEITKAITTAGTPRQGAFQDILSRGRAIWKLDENNKPIPIKEGTVLYGKDGKNVMSFLEWAEDLLREAPFLFELSQGSGAKGNDASTRIINRGKIDYSKLSPSEKLKQARKQAVA